MRRPRPADVDRRFFGVLVCPMLGVYVAMVTQPVARRHGTGAADNSYQATMPAILLVMSSLHSRGPPIYSDVHLLRKLRLPKSATTTQMTLSLFQFNSNRSQAVPEELPNANNPNATPPLCQNGHTMERREKDSNGMGQPTNEWYCHVCESCND